jgi:serpin B
VLATLLLLCCDKGRPSQSAPDARPAPSASTSAAASAAASASATPTSTHPVVAMPPPNVTAPLAKASNAFGFALYGKVRTGDGNLAMSPASISSAVAMAYGGARGVTATEIRKVLHFTGEPSAVMTGWGRLQQALSSPDRPMVLNVANRLFGAKGFEFQKDYLDRTRVAFGAELDRLDFEHAPGPSTKHINDWVEEQTQHRIKDLIAMPLSPNTRLVLVNAIYFLAKWASPFHKEATSEQDFTLASGAKKKAPMMHQRGSFRYAHVAGAALLELPYKEDVASMVVVLPDRADGLPAIEASLDAAKLESWRAQETSQEVAVTLPKFRIEPEPLDLGTVLQGLGVRAAFDPVHADFTGIAAPPDPRDRLHIDAAVHKAFVKVDEEGTEAAAATALMMAGAGGPLHKPIEFVADHPFFFAIVDRGTGLILFDGRLAAP